MKKSLIKGALFSSIILLVPLNVQAEDVKTGNGGTTKAQITFTAGNTNIDPVDPNILSEKAKPATNGVTSHEPSTGPSFIYVTPQMIFGVGNNSINFYQNQVYTATVSQKQSETKSGDSVKNPFDSNFVVEVADGRGAAANWKVNVSGSPLTVDKDGVKDGVVADGATIDWPLAVVHNSNHMDTNGSASNLGATVAQEVKMTLGDSAQSILVADREKHVGAGITTAQFTPSQITLNIPVNSVKPQTYSTTLSWTLSTEAAS